MILMQNDEIYGKCQNAEGLRESNGQIAQIFSEIALKKRKAFWQSAKNKAENKCGTDKNLKKCIGKEAKQPEGLGKTGFCVFLT